jgi:cytochrome P450
VLTIFLLLNNPEKLEKLVDELQQAFPHLDEEITFANTQDLRYLNAVISEGMRVLPALQGGMSSHSVLQACAPHTGVHTLKSRSPPKDGERYSDLWV